MDNKQAIEKIHTFLTNLGLSEDQIEVEDGEVINININIPQEERGLYIGRHAETLDSLQLILSLMVNNFEDEDSHVRILVDVAGYREERFEKIIGNAKRAAEKVEKTSTPQSLGSLSPTERRQVHMHFQDSSSLTTFSQGEGEDRRLFIAPKE